MMLEDFLLYQLCGEAVSDYTVSTRSGLLNLFTKRFDPKLLSLAGIRPDQMCRLVPPGSVVGTLAGPVARRLGFGGEVAVVACGHDCIPESLCSGMLSPGVTGLGSGTSEGVNVLLEEDTAYGSQLLDSNFCREPYLLPGLHLSFGVNANSGNLVKWFRDVFGRDAVAEAAETGRSAYQLLDEALPREPTGLLAVPHFVGSSSPDFNPYARGTITGLGLSTTREMVYKALLEGAAYELAYIVEQFRDCGVKINELRASGGGANSPAWMQIKANILNLPLVPVETRDTTVTGCAMIAGVASGALRDYREAVDRFVRLSAPILPDPAQTAFYQEQFAAYREVRAAMLTFWTGRREGGRGDG